MEKVLPPGAVAELEALLASDAAAPLGLGFETVRRSKGFTGTHTLLQHFTTLDLAIWNSP